MPSPEAQAQSPKLSPNTLPRCAEASPLRSKKSVHKGGAQRGGSRGGLKEGGLKGGGLKEGAQGGGSGGELG